MEEKKHVVISYAPDWNLFCVPVDDLISRESSLRKIKVRLPHPLPHFRYFNELDHSCIYTSAGGTESIYFFLHYDHRSDTKVNMYNYDLSKLPETVATRCQDMIYQMYRPLLVQIGDDCIYALGNRPSQPRQIALQEYNIKKNEWTLVDVDFPFHDIPFVTPLGFDILSHVVIGQKLHVSIGHYSFTFDTVKRSWKDCRLFSNFWESNEMAGLTPENFYGLGVCDAV